MQEFRTDSRCSGDPFEAGDAVPDEVPTVKIRSARALPSQPESSGKHPCATPTPPATSN